MGDCGRNLTGIGCFFCILFLIPFIGLVIKGQSSIIKTKCEVLDRISESCIYKPCHSQKPRCRPLESTRYIFTYKIDTCNRTFTHVSECERNSRRYDIGDKRTCYVNKECNNESFQNDYMIGAWVFLVFVCLSFLLYLIGMVCICHCSEV